MQMQIRSPYDHALKDLARMFGDSFVRLALPSGAKLVGTQQNVEVGLPIDRVDFLHEITLVDDPAYLHLEFQLEHEEDFPRRLHVYHALLTKLKKPRPVISVPIYLRPRQVAVPDMYQVVVGGHRFHEFTYKPIRLWEHVEEIRSGELYPLAPLLTLLSQNPTEGTLAEERQLIVSHEVDPERRDTLFKTAVLVALSTKIYENNFLWNYFEEGIMTIQQDPILKDWFREWLRDDPVLSKSFEEKFRQRAREEREADLQEQWLNMLTKILARRFPSAPVQLLIDLRRVPARQRDIVADLLLDAPDSATFQRELAAPLAAK